MLRLLLLALVIVVPVGFVAVVLAREPWPLAAFGWLVGLVVAAAGAFVVVAVLVDRRGRTLVRTTSGGTEFPASRVVWAFAGVVLGGLLVVAVVLAVVGLLGVLRGGFSVSGVVGVAFWLVLLGFAAPSLVRLARGDYQRGGLLLTAHGVVWSTYNSTATIAWKDLRGVRIVAEPARRLVLQASSERRVVREGGPRSAGEPPTPGGPRTGPDEVSVSLTFLASDGAVVAEAIDLYRAQPTLRAELGTEAAPARWRRPG